MVDEVITILTEGSTEIGFGHIRRSITLAHEIAKSAPVRAWVVSESRNIEEEIAAYFSGIEVNCGPRPNSPSAVEVLDLEPESARCHLLRTQQTAKQLCLDYFDPNLLPTSTINLIDHRVQMSAAYCAAQQYNRYSEGPEYAIIRPSIHCQRPTSPPVIPEVNHLVITFGGADPAGITLRALQKLRELASSSTRITVILGPLTSSAYAKSIRAESPSNAEVVHAPDDYDTVVSTADVVLSSGGGTLLECLCMGKPTVVFPQTVAEKNHTRSHVQAGACVMESALQQVLTSMELRNSLAENAHHRVDGLGAQRIAKHAIKLLAEE